MGRAHSNVGSTPTLVTKGEEMAGTMQCLLRNDNVYTSRWVITKKAKKGEKLIAKSMSQECDEDWVVAAVYDRVEVDERFLYHIIK